MYFGVGQQVIQQSPAYYLAYVALRMDNNPHLISYLYHAKYQSKGDQTESRHIDLNIPQLLQNRRGMNLIQSFVPLTMKDLMTALNCCLACITPE